MSEGLEERLRRRLRELGFDAVRFAPVGPVPAAGFRAWLERGEHADLAWMERTAAKRLDPALVLPGVRSVVLLGVNTWPGAEPAPFAPGPGQPRWARYALYEDYHERFRPALVAAGRALEELAGLGPSDYRYYADTGPVFERGWAERGGLGFLGKNGMLISREFGNWLLLAVLLTRAELAPDAPLLAAHPPAADGARVGLLCGSCERCRAACPTDAIPAPGRVDARRCIAYQTIENRGPIPRELRPGIGDRVFGCDRCLEVCPWNRFAQRGRSVLLAARWDGVPATVGALLELTPAEFTARFRRTPVHRLKWRGLLRNACVVAGNLAAGGGPSHAWVVPLRRLATAAEPLVRGHAVWALRRILGPAADAALADLRAQETDAGVLEEFTAALR